MRGRLPSSAQLQVDAFARQRDPHLWTVAASSMQGAAPAIIPDDIVSSLPDGAGISLLCNFVWAGAVALRPI